MRAGDLDPEREVFWIYDSEVVHLRRGCRKQGRVRTPRSGPARLAPDRRVCRFCTRGASPSGSEGRPVSSLPPDRAVLVKGSPSSCVHTDPGCHMLADGGAEEARAGDIPAGRRVCKYCSGEYESPGSVTAYEVAAMDPADLGLSPPLAGDD